MFDLDPNVLVPKLVAVGIFLLVGFPVHEFAHAYAAWRLGDGTAKMFGRLTLNPVVHLDPLGSLLLVVSMVGVGFFFGWAKPTPVNPSMLRGGRRSEAIVAAAGPVSNILMALVGAVVIRIMLAVVTNSDSRLVELLLLSVYYFVLINVMLFVFNLIPIPPLDGSKVMFALMNPRTVWQIRPTLEQYGFIILLVFVIFLGGRILSPIIFGIVNVLVGL